MAQEHDDAKTGELPEDTGPAEQGATDGTSLVDENADKADKADDNGEPEDEAEDDGIETSDFEVNDPTMLLGEMRDDVLAGLKGPIGWAKLKEQQQVYVANAVEQACRRAIRGAVRTAAAMTFDTIEVSIKDPGLKSEKEQIEAKIILRDDAGAWARLREHGKRLLVFADHDQFMNAKDAAIMRDQPGLFGDGTETPAEKAKREAIEAEEREHEDSVARAKRFTECDPPAPRAKGEAIVTPAPETPLQIAPVTLSPAERAAFDRGMAHRQADGAKAIPRDLEGKVAEASAWLKGWDSADVEGEGRSETAAPKAAGVEVDPETGERYHGGAKPPARAPRGHRGKRAVEPAEA